MRHILLPAICLALPASADDFTVQAPVTQAEIYLQGAMVTRSGQVDLPAGTHRLLVPHVLSGADPRITVTGATLGPVETLEGAIADGRTAFTEDQRAAFEAWQTAIDAEAEAEDNRLRVAAALTSAEDALVVLRSMSGANLDQLQPDAVGPFAAAVSSNVTAAEIARANARVALRDAEQAVRDASFVTAQARLAFEATSATLGPVSLRAIDVSLDAPGTVDLTMEAFTPNAGWAPRYDISLGANDEVTFDRKAAVFQSSGLPFTDVALTLSTSDPYAQLAPRPVPPNQAILNNTARSSLSRSVAGASFEDSPVLAEEAVVAPLAVAPARQALAANTDGVVVTYDYPTAVSLSPEGATLDLALDTVTMEARVFNRAAVRFDQTAFLMAEVTNTIGEPILPGQATYYREGLRIGDAFQPLVPAGGEAELSFGPQQALRVEFAVLDNETGDRGLFTTSGVRQQEMVYRIRNLSSEDAQVEARYALPFSEEEDLEVLIDATPEPNVRDVDDALGVADWVLNIPSGEEVEVRLGVRLEWPEGQTLIWNP